MDAVHWWAAIGLLGFIGGAAFFLQALRVMQRVCADKSRIAAQLRMMAEAIELYEYGAHNEALELMRKIDKLS